MMDQDPIEEEQQTLDIIKNNLRKKLQQLLSLQDDQLQVEIDQRRKQLASSLPFFTALQYRTEPDEKFKLIPLKQIVGSVSPSFERWGFEYPSRTRTGRHLAVITNLLKGFASKLIFDLNNAINLVFHVTDRVYGERIALGEMSGVEEFGSIYWVIDGTHRVSVCKVLELDQIPAVIKPIAPTPDLITREYSRTAIWWQSLGEAGLLDISTIQSDTSLVQGETAYRCEIQSKPQIPWIVWCNNAKELVELNRLYESLYPGSFKNITNYRDGSIIPENGLLDVGLMKKLLGY